MAEQREGIAEAKLSAETFLPLFYGKITNPIPGLIYSIVSAIDMPTDAKVKFFRVRVKATK